MHTWIAFALAATVVVMVPGPTVMTVIGQAVRHGRRSVLPLSLGVVAGDFTAMTLSLAGLGALMAASATLFGIFKWIGAAYLVFLGLRMMKSGIVGTGESAEPAAEAAPSSALFRRTYVVTVLNPKSIAFFVAFFPQFVDGSRPGAPQLIIMGTTFLVLAISNVLVYAYCAGSLGRFIRKPGVQRGFDCAGGTVLVGAGVLTAAMER